MNNLENSSLEVHHNRLQLGVYIIAFGLFVIAIAYVVLALQVLSTTPNSLIWSELYEIAFGLGYLLAGIGVVLIANNLKFFKK